jgi:hypothetical protein
MLMPVWVISTSALAEAPSRPWLLHVNRGIVLDEHRRGLGAGAVVAGGEVAGENVDGDSTQVDRLSIAKIHHAMGLYPGGAGVSPKHEHVGGTVDGQFRRMIEDQGSIGRRPDPMPLCPGTIVGRGDDRGAGDMNRPPRIEMGQGQGLGIAFTAIRRPRLVHDCPGRDLAVAVGKNIHQAGGDGISRSLVERHGQDPDAPYRDIPGGDMQDEVCNRAGIPDPARAIEGVGPDGGLAGDDEIVLRDVDQRIGKCATARGTAGERLNVETSGADGEVHRRVVHHEGRPSIDPGTGARNPFAAAFHVDLDAAEIDIARNPKAEAGMGIHETRPVIRAPSPERDQAADLDIMRVGKGHSGTG